MKLKMEEMNAAEIAFLRRIGPYGEENRQLMQKLKQWAVRYELLKKGSAVLGMALDDPRLTPPAHCRYDCAIVLPEGFDPDEEVLSSSLPGGLYAVFTVDHNAPAIARAWNEIYTSWLPSSPYVQDERPPFERYIASSAEALAEPEVCEICIPVRKR